MDANTGFRYAQEMTNPIRHIVLCKLRPGQDQAFAGIMAQLAALSPRLTMGQMTYGADISPEGIGRGYSHGFTIDFPDIAARDTYLEDPTHQAIGARLVALCDGGVSGILVVDI